jgi:hypothetical protein
MNTTHDQAPTGGPDGGGTLDPRDAAALLDQTQRQARRQLEPQKPVVVLLQAAVVLTVYGAIWLSVRGQDPYRGPSTAVIVLVYGIVGVSVLVSVLTLRRAHGGVSGRSRQEDRNMALPLVVAWVAVYVFMGALQHDGAGQGIVYGVVDAAGPWLMVGAALAGVAAVRENWMLFGTAVAIVVVGIAGAFAGPDDVWGVLAVAGCVGLLAKAVVQTVLLRRA